MTDFVDVTTGDTNGDSTNGDSDGDGGVPATVLFEVTDSTPPAPAVVDRGGNLVAALDRRLDDALAVVRPAAANVLRTFTDLGLNQLNSSSASVSTPKREPSSLRPGPPATSTSPSSGTAPLQVP
jgi:hypothetical protein